MQSSPLRMKYYHRVINWAKVLTQRVKRQIFLRPIGIGQFMFENLLN